MFKETVSAFIPLFVAVDAIGLLPIFVSLTHGVSEKKRKNVVFESIITALCLSVGFMFLGNAIFHFLNITFGDFMVAGGVLLFIIAIKDVISYSKERKFNPTDLGIVPIGTPLIAGPAVLTTTLMMQGQFGTVVTLAALLLNLLIAGVILFFSTALMKIFGETGARAMSKIISLLLAAIAVMMVRKGIMLIIAGAA